MHIVKKEEFFKNINTEYDIPIEIQKKLMNGNAQFIMDLAFNLKIKSYSITSVAINLCHFFFYKRCYMNYDRFAIAASCFLLASKIKDADTKMKTICFEYYKLINKIYDNKINEMLNDNLLNKLREQICIAESNVLKTIAFDFEISTPYDYLESLIRKYYNKEQIYYLAKILILDSYRTHVCIIFDSLVIAISCIIIASGSFNYDIFPPEIMKQVMAEKTELNANTDSELLKTLAYKKWIEQISEDYKKEINFEDIIDCINMMTELFSLYKENDKEENKEMLMENVKEEEKTELNMKIESGN